MDKKLRENTNLCVEIMNSERQVRGKLGHVVQFDVNIMLNLSNTPGGGYSEQSIKSQTERHSPLYCSNYNNL